MGCWLGWGNPKPSQYDSETVVAKFGEDDSSGVNRMFLPLGVTVGSSVGNPWVTNSFQAQIARAWARDRGSRSSSWQVLTVIGSIFYRD